MKKRVNGRIMKIQYYNCITNLFIFFKVSALYLMNMAAGRNGIYTILTGGIELRKAP